MTSWSGFPEARALVVVRRAAQPEHAARGPVAREPGIDRAVRRRRRGRRARGRRRSSPRGGVSHPRDAVAHLPAVDVRAGFRPARTTAFTPCCPRTSPACSRPRSPAGPQAGGARTAWRRARSRALRAPPGRPQDSRLRRGGAGTVTRRHPAFLGRAARLRQPVERVGAVRPARWLATRRPPARTNVGSWPPSARGCRPRCCCSSWS